jgi:hypothetical protein
MQSTGRGEVSMVGKIKLHQIPVIIVTLVLSMFLTSCTEPVAVSNAERDKAVIFYKKLYPMTAELKQVNDEWTVWNPRTHQAEYESQIINKYEYFEAKLRVLAFEVGALEAPPNLVNLQNTTFSAINRGAKAFALLKQYKLTSKEHYYRQAEFNHSESIKLMKQADNQYDKGLSKYEINHLEISSFSHFKP